MRIGIAGAGAIGYASAAWLAHQSHRVTLWSPRGDTAAALRAAPLRASGLLSAEVAVDVADDAAALVAASDVVLITTPVNGHRAIADALAPHLRDDISVIVSSMASLSALYLHEALQRRGCDVLVAAFGTTVLTARREGPASVRIMTQRQKLGVSALGPGGIDAAMALCTALFGDVFTPEANMLASALVNINPVAHGPLALFNWTRIERGEDWPQYLNMTPHVARAITQLDGERLALAAAFGLRVRAIETHFALSFGTSAPDLAGIAAELHAQRGGPPGPTEVTTRFLAEDIPFGLVFLSQLGRIVSLPTPAIDATIAAASLITGHDFSAGNDLMGPLGLAGETRAGLLQRVAGSG